MKMKRLCTLQIFHFHRIIRSASSTVSTKPTLLVSCVPEQVNLPLFLAKERGIFDKHKLSVEIQLVPEGTGKMVDMLENSLSCIASTVTDALITSISRGRTVRMCGVYVNSPLRWAICTHPENNHLKSVNDLHKLAISKGSLRVGISRFGSGSHTIAFVLARNFNDKNGQSSVPLSFHVANTFCGLRDGIKNGSFDIFLWETFTTRTFFNSGSLHNVGEVSAPWPAFSFAVSDKMSMEKKKLITEKLFPALQESIYDFVSNAEAAQTLITSRYHHTQEDAREWFSGVKYSNLSGISDERNSIQESIATLNRIGLVPPGFTENQLWDPYFHRK